MEKKFIKTLFFSLSHRLRRCQLPFRKLEKHSVYARTVMTTLKIWGKTSVTPTSPIPTQQTI